MRKIKAQSNEETKDERIVGGTSAISLLYTSEILSIFIHSEFTRRLNPLDGNRVLLKAAKYKTESHILVACFKGV